ncbi:MAG: ABC transporter substrate-binding protein [Candidatus Nezhaarchaeales archaeon]
MTSKKTTIIIGVIALLIVITAAYLYSILPRESIIKAATTTSLYATGLLEKLADEFKAHHPNVVVQFIAVGTGQALEKAARGDVDMVFVHAPQLEQKYIKNGVLVEGHIIAYNYFVIVGPRDDPAGIKGLKNPIEVFKRIYEAGVKGNALFVSRGDNSGTHVKELSLWSKAGLTPQGWEWYVETGLGMAKTLLVANEKRAYTLSDIGTYLKLKEEGRLDQLEILVGGGKELINIYSVYLVNPEKFNVNYELAKSFMEFVVSNEGQSVIGSYGVKEYGMPLFHPAKGNMTRLTLYWQELASGE